MDFREILPITVLRKFDAMCLKDEKLHQNKELQQQILSWAAELLEEARDNWGKLHATTFEAIVAEDRRAQAKNVAKPETTNMHLSVSILKKFKKKNLWNIKRQDLY